MLGSAHDIHDPKGAVIIDRAFRQRAHGAHLFSRRPKCKHGCGPVDRPFFNFSANADRNDALYRHERTPPTANLPTPRLAGQALCNFRNHDLTWICHGPPHDLSEMCKRAALLVSIDGIGATFALHGAVVSVWFSRFALGPTPNAGMSSIK